MKTFKYFAASLLLSFCSMGAMAQAFGLGIAFPEHDSKISDATSKILVNRLQGILNSSDIADGSSDFVVVPKTSVLSEDLIEGGMKNIYKLEIELTLEVLQLSTQKVFGTTSIVLKGSGMRDKSAAIKDAVGKIKKDNNALDQFFKTTKEKIVDYYQNNYAAIIKSAQAAANRGDYEQAIAMLSSYPAGIQGSDDAEKALTTIYNKYRDHNCSQIILEARSAISVKNYYLALDLLSGIDTDSSCNSEAKTLINSINKEVRDKDAQDHADMVRRENAAADIAKTRINAAKEVSKAYYQRTYPNYYIIF